MAGALLVASLDVAEAGVDDGVVDRQVGPAGDAEDVLYALRQCLRWARIQAWPAGDFAGFQRVRGSIELSIALPL